MNVQLLNIQLFIWIKRALNFRFSFLFGGKVFLFIFCSISVLHCFSIAVTFLFGVVGIGIPFTQNIVIQEYTHIPIETNGVRKKRTQEEKNVHSFNGWCFFFFTFFVLVIFISTQQKTCHPIYVSVICSKLLAFQHFICVAFHLQIDFFFFSLSLLFFFASSFVFSLAFFYLFIIPNRYYEYDASEWLHIEMYFGF